MKELFKFKPHRNRKNFYAGFFLKKSLGPLCSLVTSKKEQGLENLVLIIYKLFHRQLDMERIEAEKDLFCLLVTTEVQQKWYMRLRVVGEERFLSIGISVRENGLVVGRDDIFIGIEVVLDTRKCRSQSWFTRPVRMLLVLCFKAY